MGNVKISDALRDMIFVSGDTVETSSLPERVLENVTKIVKHQNMDLRISLLKEYYGVLITNLTTSREVLGVLCAHTANCLINHGFSEDALAWINKAISHDERRLIFFHNKAFILSSLGRDAEVISLVGHLKYIRSRLIDFNPELYESALNTGLTSANKLGKAGAHVSLSSELNVKVNEQKPKNIAPKNDQTIYLFACCFNEVRMLHFFLEYYSRYVGVTKFFIYDGGSTDGSVELMGKYDVEIIAEQHETLDDRLLMDFRNNYYKRYRELCDWVIVCDLDEFLYHPEINRRLLEMSEEGVTLPLVEGYNMISLDWPDHCAEDFLPFLSPFGVSDNQNCAKHLVFNPKLDINYSIGCHAAHPTGLVVRSAEPEFKNLHYAQIAYSHVILKSNAQKNRLSEWNKGSKAGEHYNFFAEIRLCEYLNNFNAATKIL